MHAAAVTAVAAAVVLVAAYGLVVTEERAGPVEVDLEPVTVAATASGTYQARPDTATAGLCLQEPCAPRTAVDLRFAGLPDAAYRATLEGDGRVALPAPTRQGDVLVLRWTEEADHTGKERIVLSVAGRPVAAVPVEPSDDEAPVDAALQGSWGAQPARARLNEIGGVTVSTVATARLEEQPPDGWRFHAFLEGRDGRVPLGPLEGGVLDARVERVGIEDQSRLVVEVAPDDAPERGFPVLHGAL